MGKLFVTDNPAPDNSDLIQEWVFDSLTDVKNWKDYTRENQSGSLYSITWDDNALKAELSSSTEVGKQYHHP